MSCLPPTAAVGGISLVGAAALSCPVRAAVCSVATASVACLVLCLAVRRAGAVRRSRRWPEALAQLTGGLAAGRTLPEALAQLGHCGPAPLRPALRAFTRSLRRTGCFGTSLDGLRERLADPVADRVCEVLRTAWEVAGADAGTLLRQLAPLVRDDLRAGGPWSSRPRTRVPR